MVLLEIVNQVKYYKILVISKYVNLVHITLIVLILIGNSVKIAPKMLNVIKDFRLMLIKVIGERHNTQM